MADGRIKITIDDNAQSVSDNLESLEKDIKNLGGLEVKIKVKGEEIDKASSKLEKLRGEIAKEEEVKFVVDDFLKNLQSGELSVEQLRDTIETLDDKDLSSLGKGMASGFKEAEQILQRIQQFQSFAPNVGGGGIGAGSMAELQKTFSGLNTTNLEIGMSRSVSEAERLEANLRRAVVQKDALVKKAGEYESKQRKASLEGLKLGNNIKLGNTQLGQGIQTLARYAMALVGIRSIYLGIQRVSNAWLNSGQAGAEQLKADLDSMMIALGSAFAPVLGWIVEHLAIALGYANALLKAFFGISLNATKVDTSIKRGTAGVKAMNKELQKQLASFDEINKLQEPVESSGGGGGGIGGIKPFEIPTPDVSKFVQVVKDAIKVVIDYLVALWEIVKKPLSDFWEKYLKPMLSFWWDMIQKQIKPALERLGAVFSELFTSIFGKGTPTIEIFKMIAEVIGIVLVGAVTSVIWIIARLIDVITGIVAIVKFVVDKIVSDWNRLIDTLASVILWVQDTGKRISNLWESLKQGAIDSWNTIKNVFGTVATWLRETFEKAWEGVKNVFSSGGKIFDGIKEGIADAFKNIVNKLIDGINKVVSKPFNAINSMIGVIRGVNIAGFQPFKNLANISVPSIPKMAKGGIVVRPTQAVVGEAGREAVLPLEQNTEWMDTLADKIGGKEVTINLINNMDGDEISRKTFRHIRMKDLSSMGTLY